MGVIYIRRDKSLYPIVSRPMIVWLEDGLDGLGKHLQFYPPLWELTYPRAPRYFWKWCSFPQGWRCYCSFLEGHFLINHLKLCLTTKTPEIVQYRNRAADCLSWLGHTTCFSGLLPLFAEVGRCEKTVVIKWEPFFWGRSIFRHTCMGQSWGISLSALVFSLVS